MALGIVKFLIFEFFVNVFDFSRKLTFQIRFCGFKETAGSEKSSVLAGFNKECYTRSYHPLNIPIFNFLTVLFSNFLNIL